MFFSPVAQAQSRAARLEGQVVCCEDCFADKDRTKIEYGIAEDLLRAKGCVEGGDPTVLAVRAGDKCKLYQLAEGKFRSSEKNRLSYVGKRIVVSGTINKTKKAEIIRVDAPEVTAQSVAEKESAQVAKKQVELKLEDLYGAEQTLFKLLSHLRRRAEPLL